MRRTIVTFTVLAALVAAGAALARASGQDAAAIVAQLNAERAANGIPAWVRENPAWSSKCADHVDYMSATGELTHSEDPSSSRYTAAGNWAGENSVLAVGAGWDGSDPFDNAPLHLIQLMSPELRQVGVAEDASTYVCVTTFPGYRASGWKKPTVYTYPGNGSTGVPYSETADELPFVPSSFIGVSQGTATGFNIMVFAEGTANPWFLRIRSASLTGPHGGVAVRTLDRTSPTIGEYLPPGSGFVIPLAPLQPGTTYRASVRFSGGVSHSWSFTTASS
jgi:hypothetical protein